MGIVGLLPFLKKASKQSHCKNYSGYTAAVDGHGWLHKGAFGCAVKLGMGEPTDSYVTYFMKYLNTLIQYGIKPVVVFDGRSLPAKKDTNEKRREARDQNRKKAQSCMRKGNKKEAWEYFVKSIHITHEMVHAVVEVLRKKHIDYIVAPFEADGQLAYLARSGFVDLVVTEDSDLVLFGCPKILFKLKMTGDCVIFDATKINVCMGVTAKKFQFDRFRYMCILSGCDYLESLPGIGLTRAKKIVEAMPENETIAEAIKKIPITLKLEVEIPGDYIDQFYEAECSFLYQLVYDPVKRTLLPLNPFNASEVPVERLAACGSYDLKDAENLGISTGSIHTRNLVRVDNYDLNKDKGYVNKQTSIWCKNYKNPSAETLSSAGASIVPRKSPVKKVKKRIIATGVKKDSEPTDTELMALYNNGTSNEENENNDSNRRRSKRVKLSLMSTDSYEVKSSDHTLSNDEDESASEEDLLPSEKKKNPFLKSPDIGLRARSKLASRNQEPGESDEDPVKVQGDNETKIDPLVLIEKNHIYSCSKKVIVKSQYFRTDSQNSTTSSDFSQQPSNVSQLSIYSVDKESFGDPETQIIDDLNDLNSEKSSNSYDGAFEDSAPNKGECVNRPNPASKISDNDVEVVTVEDNDADNYTSDYFSGKASSIVANSFTSPAFATRNSSKPASARPQTTSKVITRCRTQGLKRGSKSDSKQKTLKQMFAFQAKAKN